MLLFLNDLRKEEWFSKLPDNFKNLGKHDFYGFVYKYDYDNASIIIDRTDIYTNINIYLYKSLGQEEYLGYFKQPFNTKDTLFYYFLKHYIGDVANDFILSFKPQDDEQILKEQPANKFGDIKITDRITYQEALTKFILKSNLINPVLSLSDLLDQYLQTKYNKSLYGATIKKIVRLIKHSAESKIKGNTTDLFIIPEENGFVRYMVVGENSKVYANSEELKKAKDMLRLKYSAERIYVETGWYYNSYDGKFRKNIDDIGYKMKEGLVEYSGKTAPNLQKPTIIWCPENCPIDIQTIWSLSQNPRSDEWGYYIKKGYNGKLGLAFEHPTLYKHYPELYSLPFYFVKKLNYIDSGDNYSYRYSPKGNDIVICGHSESLESILLHEIQHAIQKIEGFSTGGNQFIASMVNSLSGGHIREYLILSTSVTDEFCSTLSNSTDDEWESIYQECRKLVIDINKKLKELALPNTQNLELISIALEYTRVLVLDTFANNKSDKLQAVKDCYTICIYTIALHKYIEDINSPYLISNYQNLINKLFFGKPNELAISKISNVIYQSDKINEQLQKKGFSRQDINRILFETYQNIFGEFEARSVQNIANLSPDLREYLLPYTSETLDFKSFSVILNVNEPDKDVKINAAIEKASDNKYILHLTPKLTTVDIIHELGHLVYDIIADNGGASFIDEIYTEKYITKYKNADEFFCDYFSGYVCRLNLNESLSNDLIGFSNFGVYGSIEIMLNAIFNTSKQEEEEILMVKYLDYLKKLLEK